MLRDPGSGNGYPTGFLRSRHGPYVPSRNRNSQLREPAGRYGTAVTVGGMLAEAGTTCPRAPSRMRLSVLSVPPSLGASLAIHSQSAIWNGRIALSALRPAGDRCREMQAYHITSMRGVAPYKRQTQLHEHRRQNQNPQIRYSADSTVSQASRPGCGEGNRCATPRNRPAMLIVDLWFVLQAATPAG